MKAWKLVVLISIIAAMAIFPFSSSIWAQENAQLNVVSAIDRTFYGNQCDQPEWAWLCMRKRADIAALGEKDSWEFFSNDFFDSSQNRWIELNFLPCKEKIKTVSSRRKMGEGIG